MDKNTFNILDYKESYDKILTKPYIPGRILSKKDEFDCVKLPSGFLICPSEFVRKTNRDGKTVLAMKYSLKRNVIQSDDFIISEDCRKGIAFLVINNVEMWYYKILKDDNKKISKKETCDFIDRLAMGCAYYCYKFISDSVNKDKSYTLYTLEIEAKKDVRQAMNNLYRYKADIKKRYPDLFVQKGQCVYTCVDNSKDSFERRALSNKSRYLFRVKHLAKIILSVRNRKINKIFWITKEGKAKYNVNNLTEMINSKLEKIGMKKLDCRTVYRYLKEVGEMIGKSADELYKEIKEKDGIIKASIQGSIHIGIFILEYFGTHLNMTTTPLGFAEYMFAKAG